MPNRTSSEWDNTYMEIVSVLANNSKCAAKKVGAVVVKNLSIVSTGVNGTPSGYTNCKDLYLKENDTWFKMKNGEHDGLLNSHDESHHEWSKKHEIHAEVNAIGKMTKNHISAEGSTIYVNYSPCIDCCKTIIASGIKEVVYSEEYDDASHTIQFLRDNNVQVIKI